MEVLSHRPAANPADVNHSIKIVRSPSGGPPGYAVLLNPGQHRTDLPYHSYLLPFQRPADNLPPGAANGVTNEVLLAIVADRLEQFQAGPLACEENREALAHVTAAMTSLHARSHDRANRGVGPTEK